VQNNEKCISNDLNPNPRFNLNPSSNIGHIVSVLEWTHE